MGMRPWLEVSYIRILLSWGAQGSPDSILVYGSRAEGLCYMYL